MPKMPATFRPPHLPSREEAARAADRDRGTARERGYSRSWDRASLDHLRRHPLCEGCLAAGLTEPAVLTDHVIPARLRPDLFWHPRNWQSACRWHHDAVKPILERDYEAGKLGAAGLRLSSATALTLAARLRRKQGV